MPIWPGSPTFGMRRRHERRRDRGCTTTVGPSEPDERGRGSVGGVQRRTGAAIGMREPTAYRGASVERGVAQLLPAGRCIPAGRWPVCRSARTLVVTALTAAWIGYLAAAVFSAQSVVSHAHLDDVASRLVEPSADATASWRDLAGRWRWLLVGELPVQLDPHLATASHRLRGIPDQLLDAAAPGRQAIRTGLPRRSPGRPARCSATRSLMLPMRPRSSGTWLRLLCRRLSVPAGVGAAGGRAGRG